MVIHWTKCSLPLFFANLHVTHRKNVQVHAYWPRKNMSWQHVKICIWYSKYTLQHSTLNRTFTELPLRVPVSYIKTMQHKIFLVRICHQSGSSRLNCKAKYVPWLPGDTSLLVFRRSSYAVSSHKLPRQRRHNQFVKLHTSPLEYAHTKTRHRFCQKKGTPRETPPCREVYFLAPDDDTDIQHGKSADLPTLITQ